MPLKTGLYTIVVSGAMNPRIHHPSWYRLMELLSEEEEKAALEEEMVCLPPVAQFQTGRFKIICQEGRWEIQTDSPDEIDTLKRVVTEVFDVCLEHTPVSAFGINLNFSLTTPCKNVAKFLAEKAVMLQLGIQDQGAANAQIVLKPESSERTVTTTIRASDENNVITMLNNYHYPITTKGKFQIGDLIDQRMPTDMDEALKQNESIVNAVSSSLEL